jgi:transposase
MGRVRRKHSREFKLEAVKALRSGQHNTTELARRLGVQEHDLRDWNKEYEKHGQEAFPGQGRRTGQAGELAQLKRELEQVKEERDILKKAMAFFARESR